MANTIRIKKRASGGASGAPSSLAPSEIAYSEVDNILHYGYGDAGGGAASSVIAIAGSGAYATLTGTQTISGDKTYTGTLDFSGATLSGNTTFSNNLTVTGSLTVNGTTTSVNSTTLQVDDKNIELGTVDTPSDTTADGGGLTLKGSSDHTILWTNSTDSWDFSEHVNLASGKEFKINGTSVLSNNTLGSGVTASSLTSVGTIATGVWNGTAITHVYGGTGLTAAPSNGQLAIGNGSGYTLATLTAGSNITITNSAGGISIAAAAGAPTAGDGIDVSGSEVSADLKANGGIVFESGELAVKLDASSITGTLAVGDGGTGATTAAGALTNLGLTATAAEVNILDGATVTTAEVNIIDGGTAATSTTLATADRLVVNDNGTMVQVALSDLVTFLEDGATSGLDIVGGTF